VQVMAAPTAKGFGTGLGVQLTVATAGSAATTHCALGAGLGPLLVQLAVPLAVLPAGGLGGKPLTAAAMSARGTTGSASVSVLLPGVGSAVLEPALVLMFKLPPTPKAAGAVKVLVQAMLPPTGKGSGAGVQLCVAPAGKPLKAQVGAAAGLGPAFTQLPLTVTDRPALTEGGTVVVACMSACNNTVWLTVRLLLPATGSAVLLAAVPTTTRVPVAGTV
jgi:hypothetical protein